MSDRGTDADGGPDRKGSAASVAEGSTGTTGRVSYGVRRDTRATRRRAPGSRGGQGRKTFASVLAGVAIYVVIVVLVFVGLLLAGAFDAPTAPREPEVEFDYRYDATDRTLTVTHAGGDAFTEATTDEVRVVGAESGTLANVSALPVGTGDHLVNGIRVVPGETITIVNVYPDEYGSEVIGVYDVPEE